MALSFCALIVLLWSPVMVTRHFCSMYNLYWTIIDSYDWLLGIPVKVL